ncbi:MAG: hypothetical protein NZ480_09295 [Bdellovibrionaceae bacterium]|nr:hypothetical protein [Pseudobdellovibrionaceae bacterium]MDW8189743.1 hypothetical protein [Pseudobdellovibrionaceae bacterium]
MPILVIFVLVIISVSTGKNQAFAQQLKSYHETIRSLGMGGVRVANEHLGISFVWNPAYLGINSGFNLEIFDAGLGINGLQAYNNFSNINWGGGLSALSGLYGKPLWVGAWGWAALSWYRYGAYYLHGYDLSAMLKDPGMPSLDVSYYDDEFYIIGFGYPINDQFSVGINLKRVERVGGDLNFSTTQLLDPNFTNDIVNNIKNSITNSGQAFGLDVGVMYHLKNSWNPRVSLAIQDWGHTSFAVNSGQKLKPIRENVIFTSTFERSFYGFGLTGGLEYRHILNNEEQLGKKIHLGAEVQLLFLDLRAGLYQGYNAYGLGVSFWLLNLDLAWYSQEMGVYSGQTPQERVVLSLNMDVSLDPDFRLRDEKGEKRKLFRRR